MGSLVLRALVLIAACWTMSAQAADMNYGSRAPYTVNQPLNAYSWAGPYLGGNLGYAWGSVDNNPTKPSGFAGGVQAGYNWQNGPWVFGVEGDIWFPNTVSGKETFTTAAGGAIELRFADPARAAVRCSPDAAARRLRARISTIGEAAAAAELAAPFSLSLPLNSQSAPPPISAAAMGFS